MATQYIEQYVRCNAFLEEKEISLKDLEVGINTVSVIPTNAVVLGIDIEVLEAGTDTMNIGVKDDSNRFINGVDLTAVKNNMSSLRLSSNDRIYPVVIDLATKQTQGKIVFRMHFFGNEVRMKDYTLQK